MGFVLSQTFAIVVRNYQLPGPPYLVQGSRGSPGPPRGLRKALGGSYGQGISRHAILFQLLMRSAGYCSRPAACRRPGLPLSV